MLTQDQDGAGLPSWERSISGKDESICMYKGTKLIPHILTVGITCMRNYSRPQRYCSKLGPSFIFPAKIVRKWSGPGSSYLQEVKSDLEKETSNFKIQSALKAKVGWKSQEGRQVLKESSNPCNNKVDLCFLEKSQRPAYDQGNLNLEALQLCLPYSTHTFEMELSYVSEEMDIYRKGLIKEICDITTLITK